MLPGLTVPKSVNIIAKGQMMMLPIKQSIMEIVRALDSSDFFLTKTIDKPEIVAESRAKNISSMPILGRYRSVKGYSCLVPFVSISFGVLTRTCNHQEIWRRTQVQNLERYGAIHQAKLSFYPLAQYLSKVLGTP